MATCLYKSFFRNILQPPVTTRRRLSIKTICEVQQKLPAVFIHNDEKRPCAICTGALVAAGQVTAF